MIRYFVAWICQPPAMGFKQQEHNYSGIIEFDEIKDDNDLKLLENTLGHSPNDSIRITNLVPLKDLST